MSRNSRNEVSRHIGREGIRIIDKSTGKCNCEPGVTESERRSLRSDLEDYIHSEPRHVDQILKYAKGMANLCHWATARDVARSTNIIVLRLTMFS